ncbi:hypothetical protein CHGG_07388 [Chaetomium globosum CBS 148.51]|uniref:Beta-xylanase n=1 Tax=Chaetomium globosum (strain ATCC 6205 / CBS 148.51 / DSM 1962 / NBRC 6347 / NRRL 1970) TaxID=306901 RepID=Q2GXB6_CHAGB|nr:uncharacterized protein CHGG_07388 [Chaetomium globosum CBS 148.51]EAQ86135.1 hypothetical protein CHGG_07388 [Chaetomium globosum CBS 148.51]
MARLATALLLASSLASSTTAQNQTQGQGLHSLMNPHKTNSPSPKRTASPRRSSPTANASAATPCTWHSQLPPFVSNGTWTPATLTAVLTAHITTVMQHYAGQCYAWDVVNEALSEDGTLRPSIFLTTLGASYIPLSFTIASRADPTAKLYYNDFNLETTPAKAAGALALLRTIQAARAPIHGIGFQAHLTVGQTPPRANLAALLRRFAALGVEVAYTELDIAHAEGTLPAGEAARERQAGDYVAVVGSCLDLGARGRFRGRGRRVCWTAGMEKKVAYARVVELLRGAAAVVGNGSRGVDGGAGVGMGGSGRGMGPNRTGGVGEAGRPAFMAPPPGFNGAVRVWGGLVGLVVPAVAALVLL